MNIFIDTVLSGNICEIQKLYRIESPYKYEPIICANAALTGNLEILKYLRSQGVDWDHNTRTNAANNIFMLDWVITNGCSYDEDTSILFNTWNKKYFNDYCENPSDLFYWAIESGHNEIIISAYTHITYDNNYPDYNYKHLCTRAISCGREDILLWLLHKGINCDIDDCRIAAMCGYTECFRILYNIFKKINPGIHELTISMGHYECFKYIYQITNAIPLNNDITTINVGHMKILSWANKRSIMNLYDKHICNIAAREGNLELLQDAIANGCIINSNTCSAAVNSGRLDILIYLKNKNCEWDIFTCKEAAKGGYLDILEWSINNGCDHDNSICSHAAEHGHINIVNWYVESGHDIDIENVYICAASGGHLCIIKYIYLIYHNLSNTIINKIILRIINNSKGHEEKIKILDWLISNNHTINERYIYKYMSYSKKIHKEYYKWFKKYCENNFSSDDDLYSDSN
jgi:hypothetical protein